ncbi:MAG: hypothetical protein ABI556_00550 [Gemmatimonadales bacterium]
MYSYVAIGLVVVAGWSTMRYARAKSAASEWLAQHHYRVRSLRMSWLNPIGFESSWLRSSNNRYTFVATVDDTQLGGTGRVFLRVWSNWTRTGTNEVEVVWDTMPESDMPGAPQPLWERLADAQLSALRRIADGETTFYAPRRNEERQIFDQLIEHVQALAQRGMITSGEPRSDGRGGGQYTSIGDLRITDEGRKWLESQSKN